MDGPTRRVFYAENEATQSLREAAYDRLRKKVAVRQSERAEKDRQKRRYVWIAIIYALSGGFILYGLFA